MLHPGWFTGARNFGRCPVLLPGFLAPSSLVVFASRMIVVNSSARPDLSQLRLGSCLWIVLVLVRAFWVRRVGH